MGIAERKERHRTEMRREILDAAEHLFVEDGYRNVSMRKIADRIEYSPTTIYRFFENKADVMHQLIARGYAGVHDLYRKVLARGHDSPIDALRDILREYIVFALEHPDHYGLWFETSQIEMIEGRLEMRHGEVTYRVYRTWLDQIDACRAEGIFGGRESMTVFQLLLCAVHGLILLRLHHPGMPWMPVDRHIDETLAMIEHGLIEE